MTGKADFTEAEWDLVREGPATAGMVVILASKGGTFRETWALAKSYAEARQEHAGNELLDALVDEKPDVERYGSAEEADREGLAQLRQAVALLEQKATPEELAAYKQFTLEVARRVSEAHKEEGEAVSPEEREAMTKIEASLGSASGPA